MNVHRDNFYPELMDILKSLSTATFVSFDMEMTGITMKDRFASRDGSGHKKNTLQGQYEEVKKAAENFQVLQIGITCVHEDRENDTYVARPWNINLSPLFVDEDRIGIDRKFLTSSSTLHFLIKNGFDIADSFHYGVGYLSRAEEEHALKFFHEKQERLAKIADVAVGPDDQEALNFYRSSRFTISEWINKKGIKDEFVNIENRNGPLNGFQRKLLFQLVANEFPGYRARPRNHNHFMQIVKGDPREELAFSRAKLAAFECAVKKQIGLRWIFEALVGGELDIDPMLFAVDDQGQPMLVDAEDITRQLKDLQTAFRSKPPVLVGHNLFTDLAFLHALFVGPLPDSVVEFQQKLHNLFPVIVDTKFMATVEYTSINTISSLDEVYRKSEKQVKPIIRLHERHLERQESYNGKGQLHEAGYDSFITAKIFLRLAVRLAAEESQGSEHGDLISLDDDEDKEEDDSLNAELREKRREMEIEGRMDQWIPTMEGKFWERLANRLRVFGTTGDNEVCVLGRK